MMLPWMFPPEVKAPGTPSGQRVCAFKVVTVADILKTSFINNFPAENFGGIADCRLCSELVTLYPWEGSENWPTPSRFLSRALELVAAPVKVLFALSW